MTTKIATGIEDRLSLVAWETTIDYDRLYLPCLVSDLGDNGADNDC